MGRYKHAYFAMAPVKAKETVISNITSLLNLIKLNSFRPRWIILVASSHEETSLFSENIENMI